MTRRVVDMERSMKDKEALMETLKNWVLS